MRSIAIAAPRTEANPFLSQLYLSIKENNKFKVFWGIDFFWDISFEADLYHIHWPEALFENWKEPENNTIEHFKEHFLQTKKSSKIIITVHNYNPHFSNSLIYKDLYNFIYSNVDGIIHLGQKSLSYFNEEYSALTCPQTIIPHAAYVSIPNNSTRYESRKKLNIKEKEFVCLSFGAIRNKPEAKLLLKGFKNFKSSYKKLLLVAGGKISHFQGPVERLYNELFIQYHASNFKNFPAFISNEEIQLYLNASDLLVIPRLNALNSGNVILGFTFGKVVVGPNIGVIGELLSATGNPTYDPFNTDSLAKALEQGEELVIKNKGLFNQQYALNNWSQQLVTRKHIDFYDQIF